MGVLYAVVPLSDDFHDWLAEQGVSYPPATGRYPTPNELRRAVDSIPDLATEELGPWPDGRWQLCLQHATDPENGPWALINARDVRDPDSPCELGFEKGWPELNLAILHAVSADTGPLLLIPDTGDSPAVVWPGRSVQETIDSWDHLRPA